MATNNFKPFAIGAGANVITQADYEALAALASGFTAGKASSAQVNKALRQSTAIASILAQFIANATGNDVLDNGDTATVLNNLIAALKTNGALSFLQTANNFSEIKSAGATAVSTALANLGSSDGTLKGRLLNVQTFLSSGLYTPTPGTNKIRIKLWSAGQGGQGSSTVNNTGGGGNAGGYGESFISMIGVSSVLVTIGAGGVANPAGSSAGGNVGGSSSFGAYIAITGASVAKGGVSTGGNILNITGQSGMIAGSLLIPHGGAAFGGCSSNPHATQAGDNGTFPGGGGAGGTYVSSSVNFATGAGANGYCYIEEYA